MRHNSGAAQGLSSPNDAWNRCRDRLREEIPPPFFRAFIEPIEASTLPCGGWKLHVEDAKLIPHIRSRYFTLIERNLGTAAARIEFAAAGESGGSVSTPGSLQDGSAGAQVEAPPEFFSPARCRAQIDKLFQGTWPSAVAWVEAVSGCGKTTLARRLVHEAGFSGPARYLTLEEYLSGFLRAMRTAGSIEWRDDLRKFKFLAIDDLQFLKKGALRTQEELRNLIDAFESSKCRIVFFSDTPLELLEFSEDLSSRLRSGLRIKLNAPDEEARRKILQSEAARIGLEIPPSVIHFLAGALVGDARRLRSAVLRLARLSGPVTPADAAAEIEDLVTMKPVGPDRIVSVVARHFRVAVEDLTGPVRDQRLSLVRQIAAYLCLDIGKTRTQDVARLLGRKNHTHALYCKKKIEEKMASDLFLAKQIREIRSDLLLAGEQP